MQIHRVHIGNFRRLKNCTIDFGVNQTILVGANNSGKTSAIQAMLRFLKNPKDFSCKDFTITNWKEIDSIFESIINIEQEKREDITLKSIRDNLPVMDVWIKVPESEVYLLKSLFPSLTWDSEFLGARILYAPKDIKELFADYEVAFKKAQTIKTKPEHKSIEVFPKSLFDFLNANDSQNLKKYFGLKYFVLDIDKESEGPDAFQPYPDVELDSNPFDGIIRIDSIEAHREFSDPEGKRDEHDTLSKQLQEYYKNNISPEDDVDEKNLQILGAIQSANKELDKNLKEGFAERINELKQINYPGFLNPAIEIHSYIDPSLTITHESAVQFAVEDNPDLKLPEKYNGLGYRNLISMYFRLIQFREEWIDYKHRETEDDLTAPERIHIVFIEEPEAHLHAQAQQVFIKKAFEALINAKFLKEHKEFKTQLILSTHSNHIVNEVDLNDLRYFYRYKTEENEIPLSNVINLSETFGDQDETKRFVTRYLKLTHCDIFFADGVILVEGAGERILMPHFLKKEGLDKNYISIIEINGSHAHRFKELIEKLNVFTLVVTDIDAEIKDADGSCHKGRTQKGKGQETNNDTLKNWLPKESDIDNLLDLSPEKKISGNVRVAYQEGINIVFKEGEAQVTSYPYTFEDALALTNIELFRKAKNPKAMVKKFQEALNKNNIDKCVEEMFNALKPSYKAPFAIELLYSDQFDDIKTPQYIKDGLEWLNTKLASYEDGK